MDDKKRYAIGVVTIVGVLGVTAYSIYLWRKQKNDITLEEAKDLISQEEIEEVVKKAKPIIDTVPTQEEIDKVLAETDELVGGFDEGYEEEHLKFRESLKNDIKTYEGMKPYKVSAKEIYEESKNVTVADIREAIALSESKEEIEEKERDYEESLLEKEEAVHEDDILSIENRGDRELRHDPNSAEAMTQFMRMELAEFLPTDDTYTLMMKLYDIPFVPTNDGDNNLFGTLVDYRAEFFGDDSIWNQRIAFADVIAHYARKLDYNLDQSYAFWMVEILAKSELDDEGLDNDILETMVEEITRHDYYAQGWDAHGLFALESPEWTEVQQLASQHIDNAVTFELEYNVFVKQYMMD